MPRNNIRRASSGRRRSHGGRLTSHGCIRPQWQRVFWAVRSETCIRILAAIDELKYVPNRIARNLRTQRTFSLAVVIPDITNPYHPAFVRGIQDIAVHQGYEVIVYNTDNQREQEHKAVQSAIHNRVDGLIGVFLHVDAEDRRQLSEAEIALVLNLPSHAVGGATDAQHSPAPVCVLHSPAAT